MYVLKQEMSVSNANTAFANDTFHCCVRKSLHLDERNSSNCKGTNSKSLIGLGGGGGGGTRDFGVLFSLCPLRFGF